MSQWFTCDSCKLMLSGDSMCENLEPPKNNFDIPGNITITKSFKGIASLDKFPFFILTFGYLSYLCHSQMLVQFG